MFDSLTVPMAAPLWDSDSETLFADPRVTRCGAGDAARRPRAQRVGMYASGYCAVIDDRRVALINLSLSGAQVRSTTRVRRDQPLIFKIGWPQDELSCAAIARVRWVQFEPEPADIEAAYRMGLVFETWDVRRLKEIIHHCRRTSAPKAEVIGPW